MSTFVNSVWRIDFYLYNILQLETNRLSGPVRHTFKKLCVTCGILLPRRQTGCHSQPLGWTLVFSIREVPVTQPVSTKCVCLKLQFTLDSSDSIGSRIIHVVWGLFNLSCGRRFFCGLLSFLSASPQSHSSAAFSNLGRAMAIYGQYKLI